MVQVSWFAKGRTGEEKTLWEALELERLLAENKGGSPPVIAVVGAGGKTSLIMELAEEGRKRGRRILVTTTTHMFRPQRYGVTVGDPVDAGESQVGIEGNHEKAASCQTIGQQVRRQLEEEGIAVVGAASGREKISWPGDDLYREMSLLADLILVEADGSRRLPIKVPADHEPVIPEHVDRILAVFGMSALGKPFSQVCFRLEETKRLYESMGIPMGSVVTSRDLCFLMREGYQKPLERKFACIPVIPVLNQADTEEERCLGMEMISNILEGTENRGIVLSLCGEEKKR